LLGGDAEPPVVEDPPRAEPSPAQAAPKAAVAPIAPDVEEEVVVEDEPEDPSRPRTRRVRKPKRASAKAEPRKEQSGQRSEYLPPSRRKNE
jgi:hypothetical protein